jgi:hypothetical protein
MHQTTPTLDPARAVRVMHFALVTGVVLAGGVFAFLVQVRGLTLAPLPRVATITAAVSIGLLAVAVLFLRRRILTRPFNETPDAYWARPEHRGAAIVLWAVTEGAALLGLIGYLLSGALAPAVAAVLATVTLAVFRPAHLEGAV